MALWSLARIAAPLLISHLHNNCGRGWRRRLPTSLEISGCAGGGGGEERLRARRRRRRCCMHFLPSVFIFLSLSSPHLPLRPLRGHIGHSSQHSLTHSLKKVSGRSSLLRRPGWPPHLAAVIFRPAYFRANCQHASIGLGALVDSVFFTEEGGRFSF